MTTEIKLTDWEIQILRECAGELPPSSWGTAVGAALEFLEESGYVAHSRIMPKGVQYLKERTA